jgi:hypothetical protein
VAPTAVASPFVLTDPGYLFIAPLLSTLPTNTVAGSVFTDAWAAAWIPLGATEDGSQFSYESTVEPITVAEFFDPVAYRTTSRTGSIAFNLASFSLSNYRRALNGGIAALTPTTGTGATALYDVTAPTPGAEVHCMIGWESQDNTLRLICHDTMQGGEVASAFKKAPDLALIPCTFNLQVPAAGGSPFKFSGAGATRA